MAKHINLREAAKLDDGSSFESAPTLGRAFLKDHLLPAMNSDDGLSIGLDGIAGLTTAFIRNSFVMLVTEHGFGVDSIASHIRFVADGRTENEVRSQIISMMEHAADSFAAA